MEATSTLIIRNARLQDLLCEIVPEYVFQRQKSKVEWRGDECALSLPRRRHGELVHVLKRIKTSDALKVHRIVLGYTFDVTDQAADAPFKLSKANRSVLDIPMNTLAVSDLCVVSAMFDAFCPPDRWREMKYRPRRERFVLRVGHVVSKTWEEWKTYHKVGSVGLAELESCLLALGVNYGMDVRDWQPPACCAAKPRPPMDVLMRRLDTLPFSLAVRQLFETHRLVYLGDLVTTLDDDLANMKGFGKARLAHVDKVLSQMECELQMDIPDWPPQEVKYP